MSRHRVHPALALAALAIVVAASSLVACGESFTRPPPHDSVVVPTDETEITLFVGDTLDLGLYMALASGEVGSCTSDAPAIAEVATSVRIVGWRAGDARLRCTRTVFGEADPEGSSRESGSSAREYFHYAMRVHVLDRDSSGGSRPAGDDEPTAGMLP